MNHKTAFFVVRIAIGTSMFAHGLVRLPKLQAFSQGMVNAFAQSMLPEVLIRPFSYVLPLAEFTVGLLLILGLFTRLAALATAAILIVLVLGSGLIESWDAISAQLLHIAFVAYLLHYLDNNTFAIDNIIHRKKQTGPKQ